MLGQIALIRHVIAIAPFTNSMFNSLINDNCLVCKIWEVSAKVFSGVGGLGGNFGTGVRAHAVFKKKLTPIIYLVFEKKYLFIYLIEQNVYIFIYCSLIFIYPLCYICKQSITI